MMYFVLGAWSERWKVLPLNHWLFYPQEVRFLFSQPASSSLVSVSDPWRAFWVDTTPFKGPRLASCVAFGTTEIQGHLQERLKQTLTVRLLTTHLFPLFQTTSQGIAKWVVVVNWSYLNPPFLAVGWNHLRMNRRPQPPLQLGSCWRHIRVQQRCTLRQNKKTNK